MITILNMLEQLPVHEALGITAAVFLKASFEQPDMLRRILNEQVVREGFRGESLITVLTRAARS